MREGWEIKKLGEVIQKTETVDPTQKPDIDFLYVVVSSVNNQGFFVENTTMLKGKDAPSRARKLIRTNDVIFATVRPTLKRIAIIEDDLDEQVCSTGYFVLRAKDIINYKFLFYYLLTDGFMAKMESLQKGASYPAITDGEVRNQTINYPKSLPEQQRIVAILDEAFVAIAKAKANAEQNLRNAKELFESYLQGVFEEKGDGWEEKALEQLVDEKCTLSYGIVQPGEEYIDGLPIVRPTDLTEKFISLNGLKRIDPKLADGYKRTKLDGNELLLCVRGSTGVVSIALKELEGSNVTRGIVPIRFQTKIINQEFGYYLLVSGYVQKQIKEKTYGAALMQINIGDLRKIRTPYPSLTIQQTIVQKLDTLSAETQKLEAIYQQKINDLEEMKKSILQKAFSGELTK